ncbi:MAG: hypothetical protein K6G17_04350 [Oscillospiraceae bacterium]|nr:hypothetical protein [Oscillospiraceae bacterium]
MKSDVIAVSSRQDCTEAVLSQAERVAAYQRLSPKAALHLRLLAEEMMNMMRAITGDVDGEFWIENRGDQYELHLRANTVVDFYSREQLLSASTSGKNEADRGLMGKIRAFFEPVEGVPMMFDLNPDGMGTDMSWSMRAYREQIVQAVQRNQTGAAEEWDELEKSVIAHVADEVKVSIRFREAEMIVYKKLA